MMKNILQVLAFFLIGLAWPVMAVEVPIMDQQELRDRLGSADLVVIDVRTGGDWSSSDRKIAGAVRQDPARVASWASTYDKAKTIVLYCA
jgi:rhodanese-related sulfurtransferase